MSTERYGLPGFLQGKVSSATYKRWLARKASAHRKRDKARNLPARSNEEYKKAIHNAVVVSNGLDAYTGNGLDWTSISKYDNEESKKDGWAYKKSFGDLPSVDHAGEDPSCFSFQICAWRTNDSKNDLTYKEFVALCRAIVKFHDRKKRQRRNK